jgi:hypothetical protein
MGTQYFHFDALARTESKAKLKKGMSIYTVAGEADRIVGFHDHIENPIKPNILYGVSFSEVVKTAEEYAEKTIDSIGRKIKKNDFVMIAGVISAPIDMSPEVWKIFKQECLKWLKRKWGGNLRSVIEHIDEYFEADPEKGINTRLLHQHLHFAITQTIGLRFWEIHPGLKAKREADFAYGKTKKPEDMCNKCFAKFKTKGRIAGDIAYNKAMRKEQDIFYQDLGEPFGLYRYGPKGIRLSREEIIKRDHEKRLKRKIILERDAQKKKEAEIADQLKKEEKKLEGLKEEANTIKDKAKNDVEELAKENEKAQIALEKTISEKQKQEDELKKREKIVSDREKVLKEREKTLASGEQQMADFQKGLKTSLRGWQLPKPNIMESAEHYLKRFGGEIMGIVQRAMNIITDYNTKKVKLDNERAAFEAEKEERQKQEAARIAALERDHSKEVQGWIDIYKKLKNRVLKLKTSQELTVLQGELSSSHSRSGW